MNGDQLVILDGEYTLGMLEDYLRKQLLSLDELGVDIDVREEIEDIVIETLKEWGYSVEHVGHTEGSYPIATISVSKNEELLINREKMR